MGIENMRIHRHPNVIRAIDKGYMFLDTKKHVYTRKSPGINVISPWVGEHPGSEPCIWCGKVLMELFGLLPSPALDCYKIVVRPRTVIELMALQKLQAQGKLSSKCGCEPRPEVGANYGGYFYTRSLEEGLKVKAIVRGIVDKAIDPAVPVFLKRGCSEIERHPPKGYGPSDKWELQPGQEIFEKKLREVFDDSFRTSGATQPEDLKREIIESWLYFAHDRADFSYLEFTNGRYLYPQFVTY